MSSAQETFHKKCREHFLAFFHKRGWEAQAFQEEMLNVYLDGCHGILNAPTGSGKTYGAALPVLVKNAASKEIPKGLKLLWLTPIRALASEIQDALQEACADLGLDWNVGIRTGDTSLKEREKQKKSFPDVLITTPESLHLLLTTKGYPDIFKNLQCIVADEWHDLAGTKRGVQVELALSRLRHVCTGLQVWGISATIGNLEEAMFILLGNDIPKEKIKLVRTSIKKDLKVATIFPDTIETLPWAGHLGIRMIEKVVPVIAASSSTLIFTNTRSQAEIWYQKLIEIKPEWIGLIAMHHGSLDTETRMWVESALHHGHLKAVVCTSSLDLGVDFRPVETVIQIGSPKGVARFMQRAGRSGHRPGARSIMYFVPTHSLEIVEGAALRQALYEGVIEARIPFIRSFDVLIQYLLTLAVSEGFSPQEIFQEVKTTFCYQSITEEEFDWVLDFITTGGTSLYAYDEYHKVIFEAGKIKIRDRRTAMRHRLSIGTISSEAMMRVKFVSGKYIGNIEEYFITRLNLGDVFWLGGKNLELVSIKANEALVRKTTKKKGIVPSWMGGRMPLSSLLSEMIRKMLNTWHEKEIQHEEIRILQPLFETQEERSVIPTKDQFLIESYHSQDGHHLFFYPFEGRFVHEGLAALVAYRIGKIKNISFSIAMNDYGFELLSGDTIPIEEALEEDLFTLDNLAEDIHAAVNETEMARRKFRDIARIAGLVFQGYPGSPVKERHLQSSSSLFFQVFMEHDRNNLLLKQAFEEVYDFQLEQQRMRKALERIQTQSIVLQPITQATPFSFPILVDSMREKFSNESLEDIVQRMIKDMNS